MGGSGEGRGGSGEERGEESIYSEPMGTNRDGYLMTGRGHRGWVLKGRKWILGNGESSIQ